MSVAPVSDRRSNLGEGPFWDHDSQTLFHVDAFVGDICRLDPSTKQTESINLGGTVTFVIPYHTTNSDLLVSRGKEVITLNWKSRQHEVKATVDPDNPTRFNDAKCDSKRRLWTGTLQEGEAHKGHLYSMDEEYQFRSWADDITVSNGITWSVDETKMYYVDSEDKKIYLFDFDVNAGTATNQRVFVNYDTTPGYAGRGVPDGLTTDVNDKLWVACYGAGQVICIDPETTEIIQTVDIPAPKSTSCCFGGPHFNILYVTSGTQDEGDEYPTAGCVFAVTGLGTRGNPAHKFHATDDGAAPADGGETNELDKH